MDTFVGRDNPVRMIRDELTDIDSRKSIRIISISGPGGVGKTFLLDHVLSELDLSHLHYLPLRVDGNTNSVTLADIMVRDLLATLPPAIASDTRYFKVTRQGRNYLQWMDATARAELENIAKDDDELAKLIGKVYDGAIGPLLDSIPSRKAGKLTRLAKKIQGKDIERLISVARRAKAYREEQGPLFGLFSVGGDAKERNLLRKDLQGRLAEYLMMDLTAILTHSLPPQEGWKSYYRWEKWKHYRPPKVHGLDRCLMIFDDYEILEPTLDDFLRRELLPRLGDAKFQTVIIILGRDSIRDVSFAWDQYFGENRLYRK